MYRRYPSAQTLVKYALVILVLVLERRLVEAADKEVCYTRMEECTCDLERVLGNLKNYVLFYAGQLLENKLRTINCNKFYRLPKTLVIDASAAGSIFSDSDDGSFDQVQVRRNVYFTKRRRRRLLRRKKRQINLGAPSNQVFEDALAHVRPHAFHQYVIFGSPVEFQCTGSSDELEGVQSSRATWEHFNGAPITSAQVRWNSSGLNQ
jgi:hypothetical protein